MANKPTPDPIAAIIRELETVRALNRATHSARYYATLDRIAGRVHELRHAGRPTFAQAPAIVRAIQSLVANSSGLTPEQLVAPGNLAPLAQPRGLAVALCRELLPYGSELLGAWFGGRHHSSILVACQRTRDRIATDPAFAALYADLRSAALDLIHAQTATAILARAA